MEGQIESASTAKRAFIILPILLTLTLFNTTLYATDNKPTPPNNELTFKAVPIIANTLAAYHNLKTVKIPQAKEAEKPLEAVTTESVNSVASSVVAVNETKAVTSVVEAVVVTSVPETKAESPAVEATPVVKEEKISSAATEATTNRANTSTSFSFSALAYTERRQYIAYFAESHTDWGFRYRMGGTAVDKGIDCSGFTRYVLEYFDIKAPRTSQEQYGVGEKIAVEQARAGDLVFFGGKKGINHVALVVSNDDKGLVVVHSCGQGIVKENISESSYWKPKLKSQAVNLFDSSQTK
jgi:cell wall-associated NlpC family hydrolase